MGALELVALAELLVETTAEMRLLGVPEVEIKKVLGGVEYLDTEVETLVRLATGENYES